MDRQRDRLRSTRLNAGIFLRLCMLLVVGLLAKLLFFSDREELSSHSELDETVTIQRPIPIEEEMGAIDAGSTIATEHPLDTVLDLARRSLEKLESDVRDYTARVVKRERIDGRLGEESIVLAKIIDARPKGLDLDETKLHIYLKFETPKSSKGREVIWVDGWNGNHLIAHEVGMLNVMRVSLDPKGMVAMLGNRYPISDLGLRNLVKKLIEKGERDRMIGDCVVSIQENHRIGDRTCTLIQVTHPTKQVGFDFHVAQIFFDPEWLVPLRYASFSWPEKEGGEPILEEEYTYLDLKFNVGLEEADFRPENKAYNFPK